MADKCARLLILLPDNSTYSKESVTHCLEGTGATLVTTTTVPNPKAIAVLYQTGTTQSSVFTGTCQFGIAEYDQHIEPKVIVALEAAGFDEFSAPDASAVGLYSVQTHVIETVGAAVFWNKFRGKPRIVSFNQAMTESEYLPTLLAKQGSGVFFEERLVSRLVELELIHRSDDVIEIVDKGGWSTLNELTAKISVEFRRSEQTQLETLEATALVPSPPVSVQGLTKVMRQRRAYLRLLDVPTSVLDCCDGVVFARGLLYPATDIPWGHVEDPLGIIADASRVSALLDFGCFDATRIRMAGSEYGDIDDYFEVSDVDSAIDTLEPEWLAAFGTDGHRLFWADLRRALNAYRRRASALEQLEDWCPAEFWSAAHSRYSEVSVACEAGWLEEQLLGR